MPYKNKEKQRLKNKEYQKKHYKRKKKYYIEKAKVRSIFLKAFINRVKKFAHCKICGESRYWVLDYHHRNPQEKINSLFFLAHYGYAMSKIKDEIRKCDILCSNCHRDHHHKEKLRL